MIDPVGRVLRVAGDKRRSCFVYAEQTAEEAALSRKQQRYAVADCDSSFDKIMRDYIRPLVELTEAESRVFGNQSGFAGVFLSALFKQLVQ